ncbi:MAG: translation initiation factor [Sulfurovum sp.]|nr:translation initiation factor [Sulfurovum sp.]
MQLPSDETLYKKNLFEMGTNFGTDTKNGWSSDNKNKPSKNISTETQAPEKHLLHFAKEKRKGKVVTIVKPFQLEKKTLQALLKTLKKRLGTGGTVKEDSLEFQGDIPDKIRMHLESMKYRFKK